MTTPSITSGQKKQIVRVCEDAATKAAENAVEEALLTRELAQQILAEGKNLQAELKLVVGRFICRVSIELRQKEDHVAGQFIGEEVPSEYGYSSGYNSHPTLDANLAALNAELTVLRTQFPELATADYDRELVECIRKGEITLFSGAERLTLVPRRCKLASTYGVALERVLATLTHVHGEKFVNYDEGNLGPDHLREHVRTLHALDVIAETQEGDILIMPIQFGVRHRGCSVHRAREKFPSNEFGLGAFEVGIMLLTHPERLQHPNDLWIDCAGDEYDDPDDDARFSRTPYFRLDGGGFDFVAAAVDLASPHYGSASGFLP